MEMCEVGGRKNSFIIIAIFQLGLHSSNHIICKITNIIITMMGLARIILNISLSQIVLIYHLQNLFSTTFPFLLQHKLDLTFSLILLK